MTIKGQWEGNRAAQNTPVHPSHSVHAGEPILSADLDTGFHPAHTHGRAKVEGDASLFAIRPVNADGSRPAIRGNLDAPGAYLPSDEYLRGFEDGAELGREHPESVIGYIAVAAFGAIAGMGAMAAVMWTGFFG